MNPRVVSRKSHNSKKALTNVLCWTRMQAEAGQNLSAIIERKELERKAGNGLFFWGIGNAPNRKIGHLAREKEDVDVVFSIMKARPKKQDLSPSGLLVWQRYIDSEGAEHPIPNHVLVTSKLGAGKNGKRVHYALLCKSNKPLELQDYGPFDPSAYRNVSEGQRPVGASQVTALVSRTSVESLEAAYRVNLRARLAWSYWVRLCQPCLLQINTKLDALMSGIKDHEWIELVSDIRRKATSRMERQNKLF